jgi:hypothetical protein
VPASRECAWVAQAVSALQVRHCYPPTVGDPRRKLALVVETVTEVRG